MDSEFPTIYKCIIVYVFNVQNSMMSELKTRVEELKMENEYQLRLKDMNYGEKIKDLTEKFLQEIESLKAKNEVGLCACVSIKWVIHNVSCYVCVSIGAVC